MTDRLRNARIELRSTLSLIPNITDEVSGAVMADIDELVRATLFDMLASAALKSKPDDD